MPKRTLWWGIGLSVGGALTILLAPPVMYSIVSAEGEAGQTFYSIVQLVLNIIRQLVLPLGTALIAASLVMFYIRGRSEPVDADRPKRWVLPEPTERGTER
ncbi:hypothetical protein ACFCVO_10855 [Agromyces sp. NPDC056379]|uniref:hypothetical protein n=1 Tax=unclassified Agromyces TaxID=2639701 RepID=UPI0035DE700D